MKILFILVSVLILSGCQPDRYHATDNVGNSSDARWAAWRECDKEAVKIYGAGGLTTGQAVSAAGFGLVGGGIGGAIFGAGISSGDSNRSNEDVYNEKCMYAKGYELNAKSPH